MKVVGINGSGRLGGNTAVLVQGFLEGAAEAGGTDEKARWRKKGAGRFQTARKRSRPPRLAFTRGSKSAQTTCAHPGQGRSGACQ